MRRSSLALVVALVMTSPGAVRSGALAVWPVDPHTKVFKDTGPPPIPGTIHMRAARNEYEPAQLAFRAAPCEIPDLDETNTDAEPLGPIVGYRATENRLRHYERVRRWPEGLVAIGDAVCALNPVYGQGMTTAALGAEVLDRCLRRSRAPQGIRPGTGWKFQRELAQTIAAPWLLATGTDYRFRRTEGPPRPRSTRMMHRYVDALTRLATRNAGVRRRLLEVFHLHRPPAALFGPGVLGPMAWAWLTGGAAE